MQGLNEQLIAWGLRKRKYHLLWVGLDNSGKSSLLHYLKYNQPIENPFPTIGFTKTIVTKFDTELTVMDCSGKCRFRRIWNLIGGYDALVFVVDVTDKDRMSIVKEELEQFIHHKSKRRIPILILANKTDLEEGLSPSDCSSALSLDSIKDRTWTIIPCSASDGRGVLDAFKWLSSSLNKT
ncbi:hypothetical protein HDV04_002589 [Boothiomyces sp. JEL0838]|nr:hypothetical protein HDV04_002589 [Boothiomyces sp. JEL0838]